MVDSQEIFSALQQLYEKEGTQAHLAELAGITQSTICAYLKGKAKVENMPVGVFLRLFRDMKIDYFGNEVKAQEDAVQKELLAIYNKLYRSCIYSVFSSASRFSSTSIRPPRAREGRRNNAAKGILKKKVRVAPNEVTSNLFSFNIFLEESYVLP